MKYLILLTIITMIVASLSANAQSNFKPGYLVNLKGDTTKGYIDYQEWNDNPTYFRFKTTAKEGFTLVKPSEVLYFNITGLDAYQSYYGPVSMDRIDRYGHEGRDSSSVIKHIFLKVLLKGPNLTLYCFTDQIKPRFFIKETSGDNSKIRELIYKFYYKNDLPVTDKHLYNNYLQWPISLT